MRSRQPRRKSTGSTLFEQAHREDAQTFVDAHIPWVRRDNFGNSDAFDQKLKQIYRTIYELATPETKRKLEQTGVIGFMNENEEALQSARGAFAQPTAAPIVVNGNIPFPEDRMARPHIREIKREESDRAEAGSSESRGSKWPLFDTPPARIRFCTFSTSRLEANLPKPRNPSEAGGIKTMPCCKMTASYFPF